MVFMLMLGCIVENMAQEEVQHSDSTYTVVDRMPVYGKCNQDAVEEQSRCSNENVIHFLRDNLSYPQQAKELRIEGKVYIAFTVGIDGTVSDTEVLHDIGGGCGSNTIKLIESMDEWTPGSIQDKAVAVRLTLPVVYDLEESEIEKANEAYTICLGRVTGDTIRLSELETLKPDGIIVRDVFGNRVTPDEITIAYRKRKSYRQVTLTQSSSTESLTRFIKKSRAGGQLMVSVVIQQKGGFAFAKKLINISKE